MKKLVLAYPPYRWQLPRRWPSVPSTFRGEHDEEFYDQSGRYYLYSQVWLANLPNSLAPAQAFQQAYQKGVLPAAIRAYADLILEQQPSMVGISSCYTPALCLAKVLWHRAALPIVLGGTCFNSGVDASWTAHCGVIDYIVDMPKCPSSALAGAQIGGTLPPDCLGTVPGRF